MSERRAGLAIVGAGVAGLAAACAAREQEVDALLVEARAEPGGRVRSLRGADGRYVGDFGPSWVWPSFQPVLADWLERLELAWEPQFAEGLTVFDRGGSEGAIAVQAPTQAGVARVSGGPQALVDALVARLPSESFVGEAPVVSVEVKADGVRLAIGGDRPQTITAAAAVIALPPRLAVGLISWRPAFPSGLAADLMSMPTWMAPHAKAVVQYERSFWREKGLSGRIVSQVGPLVECHDHVSPDGNAALWGFVGVGPAERARLGQSLSAAVVDQLRRCFGEDAPAPTTVAIHDWASEPFTAAPEDVSGPMTHPDVGPGALRRPHFGRKIWFAAAETAARSPGLIEGALIAGEAAGREAAESVRHSAAFLTKPK